MQQRERTGSIDPREKAMIFTDPFELGQRVLYDQLLATIRPLDPAVVDPIPNMDEPINYTAEQENLRVWPNGRGISYYLSFEDDMARIISGETYDGGLVLYVALADGDNFPVRREPTLSEMVRFLRVTDIVMPRTPLANVLQAQVGSRILKREEAAQQRANKLRELANSLV